MATQFTAWGAPGPAAAPGFGTINAPFGAFHCPVCGYSGPVWHTGPSAALGYGADFTPASLGWAGGWGLGGMRRWGGTYSPQYTATGLPTDEEITEMVYDVIDADPLIPYDADINVEVDAGTVTLTGSVPNKTVKHAVGDDSWWVPGVTDVRNNVTVTERRRVKGAPSEAERAPKRPMGPARRRQG